MIQEFLQSVYDQAEAFNVDPILFAVIYIGGIPLFFAATWWLKKRYSTDKSIVLPITVMGYLLIQPYLYVLFFGENLPLWVYGAIGVLVVAGGWSLYQKVSEVTEE